MVKVVILGSTGMLGNTVSSVFESSNFQVKKSYRKKEFLTDKNMFFFDALATPLDDIPDCDYLINCIGIIKPYMIGDMEKNIYVNSIFPHKLSKWCETKNIKMIHITTDCVFSGKTGFYHEDSIHDCEDEYGKSKSLGEPKNCMVLRTSIIGEEIHSFSSLVSWVKTQEQKEISGFTNHLWNGMTTKEYGVCCKKIINQGLYKTGLFHLHSNDVTKFELVSMINEKYDLNIKVNKKVVEKSCNRTLRTKYELNERLQIPNLKVQIGDM
jgi:dTDP-4-dehydrorhamnose reductase